jgi:hypothetical protein
MTARPSLRFLLFAALVALVAAKSVAELSPADIEDKLQVQLAERVC